MHLCSLDFGGYGRHSKGEKALLAQLLEMPGTVSSGLEGAQARVTALAKWQAALQAREDGPRV